ncbi:hypothetical protein DMENIID0001_056910 [Sergentomyia squamirostris]
MSVICEKVPQSEVVKKVAYGDVTEFILVNRSERPKDIPVAQKWSMEPCFSRIKHERCAQRIVDFVVRPDDVWLVGFPKSGTTWTQELTWLICNDLDYEGAAKVVQNITLSILENRPSPRLIKSHLPCHILPTQLWTVQPKIVYVARNFKDVVISGYHHCVNIQGFEESFDDFIDVVLDKKHVYALYHALVSDFFNMKTEENILFLMYEDMKKDVMSVLRKTSMFFKKNYSNEQLEGLAKHLSFENISKNPSVNMEQLLIDYEKLRNTKRKNESFRFIRRGESGAYLDEMPKEVIEKLDRLTENEMERLGCDPEVRKIFYFNKDL